VPGIEVVGVQSEEAPAVASSWRAGRVVHEPCRTFAGGLATDHPGRLALEQMLAVVDDVLLVSDDELRAAMVTALDETGQLLEGAGGAAIAAVERHGARWRGKEVVAVLTGGNTDSRELGLTR
jgi:threonine dehydratase